MLTCWTDELVGETYKLFYCTFCVSGYVLERRQLLTKSPSPFGVFVAGWYPIDDPKTLSVIDQYRKRLSALIGPCPEGEVSHEMGGSR